MILVVALLWGPASMASPVHVRPSTRPRSAAYLPDEVLVRYRAGFGAGAISRVERGLGATVVRSYPFVPGLTLLRLDGGRSVPAAVAAFASMPEVMYAQPNWVSHIDASEGARRPSLTPDDPRYGKQWGWRRIDAPAAWDLTTGSHAVVVGDIDTGLDYDHEDLAANAWRNTAECNGQAAVDDDGNGYVDDCYGIDTIDGDTDPMDDNDHGTHTAGTIGAVGDNGVGVTGMDWNVQVLPCKSHDASGNGSIASIIECYQYMVTEKAAGNDIIATNNSYAHCPEACDFDRATEDGIAALGDAGILFIAAAGNDASDNDAAPAYPANYFLPNVIAVAATNSADKLAGFSNRGDRSVLVGAPGTRILSTIPDDAYARFSGTSMATPHVTGLAALIHAADPGLSIYGIRNLIVAGGDDVVSLDGKTVSGKRIDAYGSLRCSGSTVSGMLRPLDTVPTGKQTIAVLNIDCAKAAGKLTRHDQAGQHQPHAEGRRQEGRPGGERRDLLRVMDAGQEGQLHAEVLQRQVLLRHGRVGPTGHRSVSRSAAERARSAARSASRRARFASRRFPAATFAARSASCSAATAARSTSSAVFAAEVAVALRRCASRSARSRSRRRRAAASARSRSSSGRRVASPSPSDSCAGPASEAPKSPSNPPEPERSWSRMPRRRRSAPSGSAAVAIRLAAMRSRFWRWAGSPASSRIAPARSVTPATTRWRSSDAARNRGPARSFAVDMAARSSSFAANSSWSRSGSDDATRSSAHAVGEGLRSRWTAAAASASPANFRSFTISARAATNPAGGTWYSRCTSSWGSPAVSSMAEFYPTGRSAATAIMRASGVVPSCRGDRRGDPSDRPDVSVGGWLVAATLAAAVADWVAVARSSKPAEYVCKPLTMVLLIAAAIAFRTDAVAARWIFTLAALVLCLAGDVFLMLPRDPFVAGLASFLLAHVAYVVAFAVSIDSVSRRFADYPVPGSFVEPPPPWGTIAVASAAVLVVAVPLFLRIRRGIVERGRPELVLPVALYVVAISAMVISAFATLGRPSWSVEGRTFAIAGAVLFFVSDALIGWTRFVRPSPWGPVTIMVTYHLGQVGLVLGLLASPLVIPR